MAHYLTDAVDTLCDAIQTITDVMDSYTDAIESLTDDMRKPSKPHRRRAEADPTYVGEGVWSSVQTDIRRSLIGPLDGDRLPPESPDHAPGDQPLKSSYRTITLRDWTDEALQIYRPYRVLNADRRYAKCDYKERQTLSFLDLPGEIRNQIYDLSLVFGSIEVETRSISRLHTWYCAGKASFVEPGLLPPHYTHWRDCVKPSLGLMRVNKQINAEASSVFYGHNEFRFTAPDGRDTLEAFCKTIG